MTVVTAVPTNDGWLTLTMVMNTILCQASLNMVNRNYSPLLFTTVFPQPQRLNAATLEALYADQWVRFCGKNMRYAIHAWFYGYGLSMHDLVMYTHAWNLQKNIHNNTYIDKHTCIQALMISIHDYGWCLNHHKSHYQSIHYYLL